MALGGVSSYLPANGKYELKLEWAATQEIPTLKSKIEVEVYFVSKYSMTYIPSIKGNVLELLEDGEPIDSVTFDTENNYDFVPQETLLYKHTFTRTHNSDGTAPNWGIQCKLYVDYVEIISTKYENTQISGYYSFGDNSLNLPDIQRASTLNVFNGTLGTEQGMTVSRKHTDFLHTVTYSCGGAEGTICEKSTAENIAWTPPVSLASQNTTSPKASVTITIQTIYNNKVIETREYKVTYDVPPSVKPEIALTVIDGQGHAEKYGKYIQNVSTFDVVADITQGENANITSLKIVANGIEYTEEQFTTSTIDKSGEQEITASVADERGRTDKDSVTVDVYAYTFPIVSALKVERCNIDGTENVQGEYIQVTFNANVTPLDGQNSAEYSLHYKKSTETSFGEPVEFNLLSGQYSVTDVSYIFQADTDSTYDVVVTATDDFAPISRSDSGSTALAIVHYKASGRGVAFGKISELDDVADFGFMARFFSGLLLKEIGEGTDYNTLRTSNVFFCAENYAKATGNCPVECDHILTVFGNKDGDRAMQQIITIEATPRTLTRCCTQNGWGDWV